MKDAPEATATIVLLEVRVPVDNSWTYCSLSKLKPYCLGKYIMDAQFSKIALQELPESYARNPVKFHDLIR